MGEDSNENEKGSSSGVGGSRWNPTKEQIELLERMYSHEGIRTPTADQIQQITVRLQAFGPIEGKNVFYWFQNHKARQRQKQKQELLAAQQIFLPPHHPPPFHHHRNHNHHHLPSPVTNLNFNPKTLFRTTNPYNHYHHQYLPTSPNNIKRPCYQLPQTIYPMPTQQHNYGAPASRDHVDGYNRRSKVVSFGDHSVPFGSAVNGYSSATMMMNYKTKSGDHHDGAHCHRHDQKDGGHCRCMETRTLNLFPVHPTGILEHKLGSCSTTNNSVNTSDDDTYMNDSGSYQPGPEMFDFFSSGHASSNETYHD